MGVKIFKARLSLLKTDDTTRIDAKFHSLMNETGFDIFKSNKSNLIPLKNVLKPYYQLFEFKENSGYFGVPTGREYTNSFGDITSTQIITKEEHPDRLKYMADENCILISSLKGARTPALNFDFDLSKYVFSNGFYIFQVNENWNKIFILYLLRTKRIKYVLDNNLYRGIGISTYKEDDFLRILIPPIDKSTQDKIVNFIQPIANEINILKNSKLKPLDIINEVFGQAFGFSGDYYKTLGKGMTAGTQQSDTKEKSIYKIPFSSLSKSAIARISSRFHNPKMQFLAERLHSKPTMKVKDAIDEIIKGVQPKYDTEGDVCVVKIANLKNSYIDLENPELVSQSFFDSLETNKKLKRNDVIICCTGKGSLGKVDIYESDDDAVLTVDNYLIRFNEKLNPHFFIYFFRSVLGVFQIERDFTGATNQIHLYANEILEFDIPNFTLQEQSEIVSAIKTRLDAQKAIDQQIEAGQQAISELVENAIKQYSH